MVITQLLREIITSQKPSILWSQTLPIESIKVNIQTCHFYKKNIPPNKRSEIDCLESGVFTKAKG